MLNFLHVLWLDRDKLIVWHLRYYLAAVFGLVWVGRQLGAWLAS